MTKADDYHSVFLLKGMCAWSICSKSACSIVSL
jgi:hypothetical protein